MTQSSPNSLPVSVEFFPPKTPEGVEKLAAVRQQLYAIRPEYCSVTYGAGGSTQEGTLQAVRAILSEGCDAAPHFSCIGASKASVRAELAQFRAEGIQPDVLVVRTDEPITDDIRRKIALFCNVEPDCVIQNATASTLYEVPLLLEHEGLCRVVCRKLHLDCGEPDMTEWRARPPGSPAARPSCSHAGHGSSRSRRRPRP